MTEPGEQPYGPRGDASHHRPHEELEGAWRALPVAPKDSGRLVMIVYRRADGTRETPEQAHLSIDEGLVGDAWGRRAQRNPEAQLAVMHHGTARLIANGQQLTLFGDSLFVDLDLSAANLPVGTRLRVDGAVVEVSAKPHNGCVKFQERFGRGGLRFVSAKQTRDQNLRGIYWKVVEPGDIRVDGSIEVISRG